ncbi:MAG TPA: hypothetical protein VID27_08360 [Blastocatellia bacterium]|jgi:hypothetical protein
MNNATRLYRKPLALIIAVVFTAQVLALATPQSGGIPSEFGAQLSSQVNTLDSFIKDLTSFEASVEALKKKASKTPAEIAALQRQGEGLKRRISSVQQSVQAILDKLRAAGKDTGDFDNVLAGEFSKTPSSSSVLNSIKQDGGARASLRRFLSILSQFPGAIDGAVQGVTGTATVRSTELSGRKCLGLKILAIGALLIGAKATRDAAEREHDRGKCNDRTLSTS